MRESQEKWRKMAGGRLSTGEYLYEIRDESGQLVASSVRGADADRILATEAKLHATNVRATEEILGLMAALKDTNAYYKAALEEIAADAMANGWCKSVARAALESATEEVR